MRNILFPSATKNATDIKIITLGVVVGHVMAVCEQSIAEADRYTLNYASYVNHRIFS